MLKIIKNAIASGKLCEIYTDAANDELFSVGYFLAYDEDNVIFESFDPYGNNDGLWCIEINDIYRIKQDTKYLDNLKLLIDENGSRIFKSINLGNDLKKSFIEMIKKDNQICTIELGDDDFAEEVGFIKELDCTDKDYDYLVVSNVNESGALDGVSYIYYEDVHCIAYQNIETKKLQNLYKLKNKL